jgi:hypothetical protein
METKVPAIQSEQVESEMAPVTAEYVPAKASNEEYKRLGEHNGRRRREDKILVSKWYKGVGAPQGKT